MVTRERENETATPGPSAGAREDSGAVEVWIDGRCPLAAAQVAALAAVCDRAEQCARAGAVILHVSGAPAQTLTSDVTVALVSKWEREVRRLERLPAVTIAVAEGDCGGLALDALLATDYRIAAPSVRLLTPVAAQAAWPGMALFRLARQAGESPLRRLMLFGAPVEASDALAMGLIDELTDDPASALAIAISAAAAVPGAELAIRRQLLMEASTVSFEDALGVHLAACDRALRRAVPEAAR